jgi:hypothetical protein
VNIPFLCSVTGKAFVLQFRKNRYSGRCSYHSTIAAVADGNGPAPDLEHYSLTDIPFDGSICCPHCKTSFAQGPIKCGGHFVCQGGFDQRTNFFKCCDQCGFAGQLNGGLKTISGSAAAALPARNAPPLLGAAKPALLNSPSLLLKGPPK